MNLLHRREQMFGEVEEQYPYRIKCVAFDKIYIILIIIIIIILIFIISLSLYLLGKFSTLGQS